MYTTIYILLVLNSKHKLKSQSTISRFQKIIIKHCFGGRCFKLFSFLIWFILIFVLVGFALRAIEGSHDCGQSNKRRGRLITTQPARALERLFVAFFLIFRFLFFRLGFFLLLVFVRSHFRSISLCLSFFQHIVRAWNMTDTLPMWLF